LPRVEAAAQALATTLGADHPRTRLMQERLARARQRAGG
jgi:hypothetical protein